MSAIDETAVKGVAGKDTRSVAGGVHPAPVLPEQVIAQLRTAGLVLPRGPRPGQPWAPRTDAETRLLYEARRLDRARQQLLGEVGRLRHLLGVRRTDGQEQREQAARTAERFVGCPLGVSQLNVLIGAARGEPAEETAERLGIAHDTVKSTRARTLRRLGARTITHAVAIAVAAGWITPAEFGGGEAP
ncbi:helix-turn-helix transcriptional regulator [Streptomyces scabiei]|uniref:helix-turn-helix transcriptional regulator n=1 Tax=Streptomyces scabiei TaxID=1930 RepID=UPI001B33C0A1|nr:MULTISPECIES: helix-turn-helix transcriptional regulator [Streptomyces]MDX2538851.1 helix-turn-helix transcriptional regulator [Streptomyces scabiei]MDX2802330.1 helix-turn-helix transcriptional regulator [Streptomyces scabiei]MDX3295003.1 helix-turn-helix transcriptional regulator [Streptomyces scabiei]MDX3829009.1 helix-turn-helix transcriptional regulator [Streptomyces scabiei]